MEQKEIEIDGFTFPVIKVDSEIYTSINTICRALGGLDDRSQIHRINRTPLLQQGLRKLILQSSGNQLTNCLHVSYVDGWLEGVRFRQPPADDVLQRQKRIRADFERFAKAAFGITDKISDLLVEEPASSLIILPDEEVIDPQELLQQQVTLTQSPYVTINTLEEDRAFRQAALARRTDWNTDVPVPWYLADNQIQVYLGHPRQPLDLLEAQKRLRDLNESAVLTSRIAIALWNIFRQEQQLGDNGSIPIKIETILEWRGTKKHTRVTAGVRVTDGYERKYKEQVLQDFYYLQTCYLLGHYTQIDMNGVNHDITVDGPYARVSIIRENITGTLWKEEKILGFLFSPGDWIYTHAGRSLYRFAHIDRRAFQLHPSRDQYAIRIILFLVEKWCEQSLLGNYNEPIRMRDLLTSSMITIDNENFARFSERIEKAVQKLQARELVSDQTQCLDEVDKSQLDWHEAWLNTRWCFSPPQETVEYYANIATQDAQPLLLDSGKRKRRLSQKNRNT